MRKKIVIGLLVLGSSLFAEKSVPVMVGGDSDLAKVVKKLAIIMRRNPKWIRTHARHAL